MSLVLVFVGDSFVSHVAVFLGYCSSLVTGYSVSLFVGNKNDTLNAYYIISADGGSIYLTETSLADAFSKTIEELTVTEDTESTETVENTEE